MRVKPWEEVDLETHWGWLNVLDRVILDVGADYGSTADFFLSQGAAQVIAVEGDERTFRRLKALAERREGLKAVHMRISSVVDWEELLTKYPAQVVKVDCEGPEGYLLEVDNRLFRRPLCWAVELHTPQQARRWGNAFPWKGMEAVWTGLREKFLDCGFQVARDVPHWTGRVVCGVRGELLFSARPGDSEGSVKAVVLGPQRTGTALLEESLASLDRVEGAHGMLRLAGRLNAHDLRDFFGDEEAEVRICSLAYEQVTDPLVVWLQMNQVHVIHLVSDGKRERGLAVRFRHLFKTGPYLEVSEKEVADCQRGDLSDLPLELACRLVGFLDLEWRP